MKIMKDGICYIIGSSKEFCEKPNFFPREEDFVIAADGGYDILKETNITPDIIMGDFDSVLKMPSEENVIKYPAEKDETDTFLAYRYAYEKGYRKFVVFGGMGGREDHTVANIQTLANMAQNGARGFLAGNGTVISVISDSKINIPPKRRGTISVFALGGNAQGVTIKGLKYNLDDYFLKSTFPLGVSNEFIGEEAEISVEKGMLLIIWSEKESEFLSRI